MPRASVVIYSASHIFADCFSTTLYCEPFFFLMMTGLFSLATH
jgi:hypothetical protein